MFSCNLVKLPVKSISMPGPYRSLRIRKNWSNYRNYAISDSYLLIQVLMICLGFRHGNCVLKLVKIEVFWMEIN